MLKFRTKKTHDHEASSQLPDGHEVYDYHVEQVFVGHHTIFSLLGLAIGADLVARTIFDVIKDLTHPLVIISIGLLVFVLSGILVGSFRD